MALPSGILAISAEDLDDSAPLFERPTPGATATGLASSVAPSQHVHIPIWARSSAG